MTTIAAALDRTPAAVRTYLRDHPDLFPALRQAQDRPLRQAQGEGSAEGCKGVAAEGGGAAPDAPVNPTPFSDLAKGQCRWPVDLTDASGGPSMACCGAPVVDRRARPGRREATHCAVHLAAGTGRASGAPFVVRTTRKTRKDQPWDA